MRFTLTLFIGGGVEEVWHALTDAGQTSRYWGHRNVSDWRVGSTWRHERPDGSGADVVGLVLDSVPGRRLVTSWADPAGVAATTRVCLDLAGSDGVVRVRVTHENLPTPADVDQAAEGWSAVLSNLKTLVETGAPLPVAPWTVGRPPT